MIGALSLLLCFQLAGEALARTLALPLPGPVLGLALLAAALALSPRLVQAIRPVSEGLLGHLSLLFVPAGVGIVGHLDRLGGQGLALLAAVFVSTVLAITAGALAFAAVARATGLAADD
jgi:holin-like protein